MIEDDTMLLDTGTTLFVWVGSGANEIEKKQGLLAAREYLKQDPSGAETLLSFGYVKDSSGLGGDKK